MNDVNLWTCTERFALRMEDTVPQAHQNAIYVALKALLPEDEDDFEEGVEVYEEDFEEEGPAPFESPESFEVDHILHALTLVLVNPNDMKLNIAIIQAGALGELVSVYGGTEGYVVQGETLFAFNCQGSISLMEGDANPLVTDTLHKLIYGH